MTNKNTNFVHFGVSTRARVDPLRRVGNANAVAEGVNLSCVAVISDRELAWIRRLAYEDDIAAKQQAQKAEKDAYRKATSVARVAKWPDTLEARRANFLSEQSRKIEEAERRKKDLDDLYIMQLEEQRLASMEKLEIKNLREDPRGRNVKSMCMLHDAIKGREEQIAFKQLYDKDAHQAEQEEVCELQRKLWGDAAEAEHLRLLERQRNLEEKNANMEMVYSQIAQRRQQREAAIAERQQVEREADEERQENEAEEAEKRARIAEIKAFNSKLAMPHLTPTQKLLQRSQNTVEEDTGLLSSKKRQELLEQQKQRRLALEKGKEIGLKMYAEVTAKASPKHRTQDLFEQKFPSFLDKIESGEVARVKAKKQNSEMLQKEREAAQDTSLKVGPSPFTHRKAEASAFGFLNEEEERAHLEGMHRVAEQIRAEEAAEKASTRATAEALKAFQKQQVEERSRRVQHEKDMERLNARKHMEEMAMDDAKYLDYIRSQIPEDMDPVLVEKAIQMQ